MMERSIANMKQILRENVARFIENANGREVIISVTARLVKKSEISQEDVQFHSKDIKVEHAKRNHVKNMRDTSSQASRSSSLFSQDNNSAIDWYGKGRDRYHYSKE
ncbi:unnamed protein product [Onchocerca flexuosa]|uniref:AAA_assoc domain-containing protein n=1 Tax=Onchocerca flexuosa TaxID=387005 RepID=A0A183H2W8_9BILA|nr:unnamed protein product [Onchocerca flexuosa]